MTLKEFEKDVKKIKKWEEQVKGKSTRDSGFSSEFALIWHDCYNKYPLDEAERRWAEYLETRKKYSDSVTAERMELIEKIRVTVAGMHREKWRMNELCHLCKHDAHPERVQDSILKNAETERDWFDEHIKKLQDMLEGLGETPHRKPIFDVKWKRPEPKKVPEIPKLELRKPGEGVELTAKANMPEIRWLIIEKFKIKPKFSNREIHKYLKKMKVRASQSCIRANIRRLDLARMLPEGVNWSDRTKIAGMTQEEFDARVLAFWTLNPHATTYEVAEHCGAKDHTTSSKAMTRLTNKKLKPEDAVWPRSLADAQLLRKKVSRATLLAEISKIMTRHGLDVSELAIVKKLKRKGIKILRGTARKYKMSLGGKPARNIVDDETLDAKMLEIIEKHKDPKLFVTTILEELKKDEIETTGMRLYRHLDKLMRYNQLPEWYEWPRLAKLRQRDKPLVKKMTKTELEVLYQILTSVTFQKMKTWFYDDIREFFKELYVGVPPTSKPVYASAQEGLRRVLDSLTKKGILNRGMARKSIRSPRKKQKYYSINISRRFVMIVSREKEIKQRIPDRSPT